MPLRCTPRHTPNCVVNATLAHNGSTRPCMIRRTISHSRHIGWRGRNEGHAFNKEVLGHPP